MTIFNKIEQFNSKGSFEGWMRRVTVNTVLQKYRKEGVFELAQSEIEEEVTLEVDEEDVSLDYLLGLIQGLPDRYRLTFNLYALDGYSHKEISNMLNITTGTSKSNLARARMILKNKIEADNLKKKVNSLEIKMRYKKNIDRLFQEKFKDFEVAPDDSVWSRIESELDAKSNTDRKAIPLWWKLGGIAAAFALLFAVGYNSL